MPQTSLIPKKVAPRFQYAGEALGIFFRVALVFFLLAATLTGGLYAYKAYLNADLEGQKAVLEKLEVEFEPSLIGELERVAETINAARKVLSSHLRLTDIFRFLENNTLVTTRFRNFTYSHDQRTIALTGEASSYAAVAAQAVTFRGLPEVQSAVFTSFALQENGNVSFSVNMNLNQ